MLYDIPAPLDIEAMAVNDELVEGFLRGHLGSLSRGKLDEGALLPLHYGDGADLPKLVEMVPGRKKKARTKNKKKPKTNKQKKSMSEFKL